MRKKRKVRGNLLWEYKLSKKPMLSVTTVFRRPCEAKDSHHPSGRARDSLLLSVSPFPIGAAFSSGPEIERDDGLGQLDAQLTR